MKSHKKNIQYTPALIQKMLRERGITQKRIAAELGKSPMAVSDVINFKSVSQEIMRDVARRLDADPRQVFAWYYSMPPRRPSRVNFTAL
jgi:transcriptional regulator with XRE-family HTH domain